jgi:hypothetical protein
MDEPTPEEVGMRLDRIVSADDLQGLRFGKLADPGE